MYRCNVTGQTNDENVLPLGGGTVPVECANDPAACVKGPKQPMVSSKSSHLGMG